MLRLAGDARTRFAHVLLVVVGNHDHYGGLFAETAARLRAGLPGVTVLDNETVEIDGVRSFGGTLWADFEGRSKLDAVRRRCGEFFFVKVREADGSLRKFRPEDALAAFDATRAALTASLAAANGKRTVVITHHAPSRQGLNPHHVGEELNGAYASDLDNWIAELRACRCGCMGIRTCGASTGSARPTCAPTRAGSTGGICPRADSRGNRVSRFERV